MTDTLGLTILSFVERLSSLWRLENLMKYEDLLLVHALRSTCMYKHVLSPLFGVREFVL